MESWEDQGIVLSVRGHGESGAIVTILTAQYGRYAGYFRGAQSFKNRAILEQGNLVDVAWQSRTSDGLGAFALDLQKPYSVSVMSDSARLAALQSACMLCQEALPEREKHEGLFYGLCALFDNLDKEVWGAAYIMWELSFLRELGFSLDLSKCAAGGDVNSLAYVSPKTGRAVSFDAGEPYKDKLLKLPSFLKPNNGSVDENDLLLGLKLTGYFLEHWAFTHHTSGLPHARIVLQERLSSA